MGAVIAKKGLGIIQKFTIPTMKLTWRILKLTIIFQFYAISHYKVYTKLLWQNRIGRSNYTDAGKVLVDLNKLLVQKTVLVALTYCIFFSFFQTVKLKIGCFATESEHKCNSNRGMKNVSLSFLQSSNAYLLWFTEVVSSENSVRLHRDGRPFWIILPVIWGGGWGSTSRGRLAGQAFAPCK